VSDEDRVILLEAAPLLVLAALYLGLALGLVPHFWRERGLSWLGLGVWTLFLVVGGVAGVVGALRLGEEAFLAWETPWPVLGVALAASIPALVIVARWNERGLLASAGRRIVEAERRESDQRRQTEAISRLSE
jgi:hypothetical protein